MIDVSSHKGSFLFFVFLGRLAEWSNALVLKTSVPQGTVGSNPTSSAEKVFGGKFLGTPYQNPTHVHCVVGLMWIKTEYWRVEQLVGSLDCKSSPF